VGEAGLTNVVPVVFLMFLLWLLIYGPGPVSLDAALARWLRLGKPPEPEPESKPD